jgi:hypothetical protein
VAERVHPQPLVECGVVEVLDAELKHLPEGAAIALVDVDVAERKADAREVPGRQLGQDDAGTPVVDVAVGPSLQDLAPDEARVFEPLVQEVQVEEAGNLVARMNW